jgi:hypothetical protein
MEAAARVDGAAFARSAPVGAMTARYASIPPPSVACTGAAMPNVRESVDPATCAAPARSTAIPRPWSSPLPPRKVL